MQKIADSAGHVLIGIGLKLDKLPENLASPLATPWNTEALSDYNKNNAGVKALENFIKQWNLTSEKASKAAERASKKAESAAEKARKKAIEEQKTRLEEVKKFYAEYKKYRDVFGDEKGQSIVEDMFGMKPGEGDRIIKEYEKVLDEIQKKLEELGDDKGVLAIKQLKAEINLDKTKKEIDKAIKEIQEYISKKSEKFNLYKALLEKTGNKDFAKLAFEDGKIWDDLSKELAEKLKEAISSAGADIDINTLWDKSDAEAQKMLEGINGAYELWKKIVDIIRGNYTEALKKGSDAMAETMSSVQKIKKLEQEILDIKKKEAKMGEDGNPYYDKATLAQIEKKQREIQQLNLSILKEDINWDAVFGNLEAYTKEKLVEVRNNLRNYLSLNKKAMDVKDIKDIEGAISNLNKVIADKSGIFSGLKEAMDNYRIAVDNLTQAEKDYQDAVKTYGAGSKQAEDAKKKRNQAQANLNGSEVELNEQRNSTINKLTSLADAITKFGKTEEMSLSDVGNIVGQAISALSKTNTAIGNLIAAIISLLDAIGQDPQGFANNLFKGIGNGIYGINSLLNGWRNTEGVWMDLTGDNSWITQKHYESQSLDWMKGPDRKEYETALQRYQGLVAVWDELIAKKKEYININWGNDVVKAEQEALDLINKNIEAEREMARAGLGAGSSFWSHSYGYRMWDGSAVDVYGRSWADVADEISRALGIPFRSMEDLTNMSAEQLQWIKENYSELWAVMYPELKDHLENIIQYGESAQDVIEKASEKLVGISKEDYFKDFLNSLYELANGSEDVFDNIAENWQKMVNKMVINNIVAQKFQERVESWYDKLTDLNKQRADGLIGDDDYRRGLNDLSNEYNGLVADAYNDVKRLRDIGVIQAIDENIEHISNLRDKFLEALTDMESGAENFRDELQRQMLTDLLEQQVFNVPITINKNGNEHVFDNFDAYAKDWNKRYNEILNSEYLTEEQREQYLQDLIDELVEQEQIMAEGAEKIRERLNTATDDTFKGMSDSWVSNLMDMSQTAEDWAEEIGKTMAEKIIKEMIVPTLIQPYLNQLQQAWDDALPKYTTDDEYGNKTYNWEGLLGDNAVRSAIEAINAAYPAASEAVKTVLERLGIDISNYKYSGFSNLADSILESLKKSGNNFGDWAKEQGQKMAEQMAKAYIDQTYKNDIDALNKEWQEALEKGDAAAIDTVRKKLEALYARMGNDPELMKLIEDFKELDTTVTDLADSFVSSLMDMSKSARDWGQDLAKTIAEAVVKMTVVPTLIQPLLQGVQDVFNNAIEAATSVDENGKKTVNWEAIINNADLMAAINGLVEQYPEIQGIVEKIMSAFGVDMYENPFSDMVSEFTSSLMDMEQSAEDFALSISKKLTEQMIQKVITDGYKGQIDQLGEQWREALENGDVAAIERIKQQLVELRAEMGDAVQPLLDAISDIEKQADTTFSSMTDSWVSALMDMESTAEDFAQQVGKTMAQKIITEMIAPMYLQPILDAMQKAYNLAISQQGATVASVVATLRPFIGQITDVYNAVTPIIQELFGDLGVYVETVEESVEEAAEEVQYALQDLKSNFVSSLMDMESSAEDFSKSISKILAQSFIEKFVLGDAFDAQMKRWQEQYESIIGSGMSEEERKRQLTALRDAIAAAKEGYVDNAMAVMDLLGLTTEDSQEATMNMADKITYDQADQLLGTSLAQLLVQEQILATLHGGSVSYTPSGTLTGGSVADNEQSQLMLATMQSMSQMMQDRQDGILTQVAMANSHLQLIRDYNKQIRDEVVMHMASMDNKLSHLRNL